jgi:hypothetical protein
MELRDEQPQAIEVLLKAYMDLIDREHTHDCRITFLKSCPSCALKDDNFKVRFEIESQPKS